MIIDLFSLLLNKNLSNRKIDFVFLVHARKTEDIFRKYPLLKFIPINILDIILFFMWPVYGGSITGVVDTDGNPIKGALIIVPRNSGQILKYRKSSNILIHKACRLSNIYGTKVVGLGALTSVVTSNGDLIDKNHNLHLTSGNSLTAYVAFNDILNIIRNGNYKGKVAVIGGSGSIGKQIALLLSLNCDNKILIIGKNLQRTNDACAYVDEISQNKCESSTDINDCLGSDILVVTTSAPNAIITKNLASQSKIIYDITQPKNTDPEIKNMPGIKYIEGGLIRLPNNIRINMDIGLKKHESYACLAETILLSITKRFDLCSRSKINYTNVIKLGEISRKYDFKSINDI
jgi:fatty aldehyde-generating acyl-ACP reductase